jgi:hypothetical protein
MAEVIGVLPEQIDLMMYQGDDFYMTVRVLDDAGGLAVLTGFTARSQIRSSPQSATVLATFATVIRSPGYVDCHLPGAITATLTPGAAVWDFELTDPSGSGQVSTPCAGNVTVVAQVTR